MSDDRPIRYAEHDGTIVYRASGLGACDGVILGLAAGRKPNDVPAWLQEVFDEGHRAEPMILDQLLTLEPGHYNHLVLDTQTEWELEVGEINGRRVIVRGHSDAWDPNADVIVECKKFRDSTWPKFMRSKVECSPLYPWQVSSYMHAAGQQGYGPRLLFVGGHWVGGELPEIGVFEYADPPISLSAIRRRIARWENMIESGMDLTDLREKCSTPMFPCPMYRKGCPNELDDSTVVELTGDYILAAETLIAELEKEGRITKTANEMLKSSKERKSVLEDGLRALQEALVDDGVVDAPPKKMRVGEYVVSHVNSDVPEKVVKGYTLDYFKLTPPKAQSTKEGTTP
jgi:hypothetical protein